MWINLLYITYCTFKFFIHILSRLLITEFPTEDFTCTQTTSVAEPSNFSSAPAPNIFFPLRLHY